MGIWGRVRQAFGSCDEIAAAVSPQDLFAADVEAALRKSPSVTSVRRGADEFQLLVTRGGVEQTMYLGNVFAETRDMSPDQRGAHIARFVRTMETLGATAMSWDEVRPKLAPLLRTPSVFGGVPEI